MIPYPNNFWKHTVVAHLKEYGVDSSLGTTVDPGEGISMVANVQDNPSFERSFRTQRHGTIEANNLFQVYFRPDAEVLEALAAMRQDDILVWNGRTLGAISPPVNRHGEAYAWVGTFIEVS